MKITHYGHACVLVETDAGRRVLLDPGSYSTGFDDHEGLDVIAITQKNTDHVAADRLAALLARNPGATVVTNADVAASLELVDATVVGGGETRNVAGVSLRATGGRHEEIHPEVPNVDNTGFVIDGRVWHPGDSLAAEIERPPVLLVPVGGPWMKVAEAIEFVRAVRPEVVVPVHQAGLADVHRGLHYSLLTNLAPEGTRFVALEEGAPTVL
jgi:L-ascorbate metabolism protein UlaG (beta-lactamase superfamily)